jgi:hypothetical protein
VLPFGGFESPVDDFESTVDGVVRRAREMVPRRDAVCRGVSGTCSSEWISSKPLLQKDRLESYLPGKP